MRFRTSIGAFLLLCVVCQAAYDKRLVHVLAQLRECRLALHEELPMVGGPAVGAAGTPHEFYLLMPYVSQVSSDGDLQAMLRDPSPVVRVMGANCIFKRKDDRLKASVDVLAKDRARLFVAPFGCDVYAQTVSELVADLKKNPDLLSVPPK